MYLEVLSRYPTSDPHPTPILFVPGGAHGAWTWEEYFLPYFAQHGYEGHALNLRGHGGSGGKEKRRWTSGAEYVADVAQVAAGLPSTPILVGHSMGGYVVQKYLETHPAAGAVLMGAIPPNPREMLHALWNNWARRHPFAFLKANLTLGPHHMFGTPQQVRDLLFSPTIPEDRLQTYAARIEPESFRILLDILWLNPIQAQRIQGIPMLVLGGTNDVTATLPIVQNTALAYGTEATILPNIAHNMMLEEGWQSVADTILTWVKARGF